ncbi:MAG: outer membrane protein transport protein, partial [Chlorobi bacterium]|nr:outer membrane protein transport protein [Chlorobiota bacterium]
MKIIVTIILFAMMSASSFANGLSLNSIGPKALGMGGAMIGLADDYTAVYWNPAGITQLENAQIGVFGTAILPTATYKYAAAGIDATSMSNQYISPSIMGYVPLLKGDLTIGVSMFVPAGLGIEWAGADLKNFSGQSQTEFKWSNEIGVINISPVIAYKFNEKFSVGAALNIHYGMFDMHRPMDLMNGAAPGQDGFMDTQYEESSTGMGYGVSLGALFKATDYLSVGVSFKTKNTLSMTGDANNPLMAAMGLSADSEFERDLSWPMWVGGGIAVKPMDKLTVTLDAQWSQWSESMESIVTTYNDWVMQDGNAVVETMHMNWEDALQLRFGVQYEVSDKFALRGGLYHDPAPAPDESMNIIFPSNT